MQIGVMRPRSPGSGVAVAPETKWDTITCVSSDVFVGRTPFQKQVPYSELAFRQERVDT